MYVCMTHQIDVLSAQKCSCLSRCVRARIVVVKSELFSAVGFPDFLKDNCLLYFGIRQQNQILIIENRFIVFQNIPH